MDERSYSDAHDEREAEEDCGNGEKSDERDDDGCTREDAEPQSNLLRPTHLLLSVQSATTSAKTRDVRPTITTTLCILYTHSPEIMSACDFCETQPAEGSATCAAEDAVARVRVFDD